MSLDIAWEHLDSPTEPDREVVHYVDLRLMSPDNETRWKRCLLTSDYLAHFLTPNTERDPMEREELSIVIDELLANAVKFSVAPNESVSMAVQHFGDAIRVEASNLCDERRAKELVEILRRTIEQNLEELFVQQVENNADDVDRSQLGFITLRLNFGARLGARIREDAETGHYRVTVAVVLDRSERSE
ncbi:MAG: hypothetical protein H6735_31670 [Alphaproteobacteria bacterium]|nr:hypothetical protein [Alphaproteobacteria bacterium]